MPKNKTIRYFLAIETTCKSVNLNKILVHFIDADYVSSKTGERGESYIIDLRSADRKYVRKVAKQIEEFFSDANTKIAMRFGNNHTWYRTSDLYNNVKVLGFKFLKETTTTETQIQEISH